MLCLGIEPRERMEGGAHESAEQSWPKELFIVNLKAISNCA